MNIALLLQTDATTTDEAVDQASNFIEGVESENLTLLGPVNSFDNGVVGVVKGDNPPSTVSDVMHVVNLLLPGASVSTDDDGQVVIYTDKREDDNGSLVDLGEDV